MQQIDSFYKKLILVCTNVREDGRECCGQKGSIEFHPKLKEAIKAIDPSIRVSKSGCLGQCSTGMTVVLMPQNIWLGGVTEEDIPVIINMATQ